MKKFIFATIFTLASCAAQPAMAGYDKDLCEWSMTADQTEVETQIEADIMNIVERDRPKMKSEVQKQLKSGGVMQYNYVLYCDKNFNNKNIVTEITGE
ncbi:spackle periplasmic protein [Escherichia phage ECP52]|nr:spackle periplasmic protein [Escherichia phage ECP52]